MTVKFDLKNKIINGCFDFWQRGTSFSYPAGSSAGYCADRFTMSKGGVTLAYSISKSSDVPPDAFGESSLLATVTTAQPVLGTQDLMTINQHIEGNVLRSFKDKKMVFKFKVKSSKAGTYCICFRNNTATRILVKEYTIDTANTWQNVTLRFAHNSVGTWAYDQARGMVVSFILGMENGLKTATPDIWLASSGQQSTSNQVNHGDTLNATFQLADILLVEDNEGQNRNPDFMYAGRDYFEELQLCQRYYEKSYELDTTPGTATLVNEVYFWGPTAASTVAWFNWTVPKRVAPAMQFWNRNGTLGQWVDSALAARSVDSSVPRNTGVAIRVTPGAVNRELQGHFAADAEL